MRGGSRRWATLGGCDRRGGGGRGAARWLTALAALCLTLTSPTPAGAQSAYVSLDVRVSPSRPEPGDDVTVTARVTECPPGATLVEVLLTSSDLNSTSAALMAESLARTSLLWRTKAVIELPDAIEGWYGIRVQCGTFVPDHVPMANTYFAVGANPTKEARVWGERVEEGKTLRYSGTGCPGTTVEYEVKSYNGRIGTFIPDGTISVAPDGTWSADIPFDISLTPGPTSVRARCTILNRYGQTVYISYGRPSIVTVLRAAEGSAPPVNPGAGVVPTAPGNP